MEDPAPVLRGLLSGEKLTQSGTFPPVFVQAMVLFAGVQKCGVYLLFFISHLPFVSFPVVIP